MSIYNLHRTCPGYDYNLCIALLPGAPQVELVMADLFISWLIRCRRGCAIAAGGPWTLFVFLKLIMVRGGATALVVVSAGLRRGRRG